MSAHPRSPTPTIIAVSSALFCDSLLYSVVVPVLPVHARTLGLSSFAVGVLFASYAVTLLVAAPLLGRISDRFDRRRPVILGMAGVTGATVLFALADGFPGLVAARSLQGVAAAAVWTSGIAAVADRVPAQRVGSALGMVMAAMSAGLIAGPPVGGVLVDHLGYRAPFFLCAVLAGACTIALTVWLERSPPDSSPVIGIGKMLSNRSFRRTLLAVLVGAGTISMLEPLLPIDLGHRLGADATAIGAAFGAAALLNLVASPLFGALADRFASGWLIPGGLLLSGALLPFLTLPPSVLGVGILLAVYAIAFSAILTPALSKIAEIVREYDGRGYAAAYGAFNVAYAGGMVVGPISGSAATSAWTLPPVLLIAGMGQVAAALLFLARRGRRAKPHLSRETPSTATTLTSTIAPARAGVHHEPSRAGTTCIASHPQKDEGRPHPGL